MIYLHPTGKKGKLLSNCNKGGGLTMLGGIYKNKSGVGAPFIVKFPGVFKRFWDKKAGERFLTGLRFKFDEGTFDRRDYQKDNPLGFENQSNLWLDRQKKKKSFGHIKKHIAYAQEFFANQNIKEIGFGLLDDFFFNLPGYLGNKTKDNIKGTLHTFWVWISDRESIPVPKFPQIKYVLRYRKTVSYEDQQAIIQEVKRVSKHIDVKVGIAIEWLARYYSIRPIELLHIKEEDFDFELGGVNVKYNKVEDQYKWVPMLWEDLKVVRSFPKPIRNDFYFFRYKGRRFGRKRLYKWWKRACANLNIKDVDLYGGTVHSTTRALRALGRTPEEIKKGSMRQTSKAFNRYFQMEMDDMRGIYGRVSPETNLKLNNRQVEKGK